MTNHTKHFILLNIATAFIATSGFLGKMATDSLSVESTLFWRCLFAVILLFAFVKFQKQKLTLRNRKDLLNFLLSGILFYGHLFFYFKSIQLSSVAIAVLSMFTFPVMTAIIEPLWRNKPFSIITIISSVLIISGTIFIIPNFDLNNDFIGILLGLASALCYTIRNIQSSSFVNNYSSNVVMIYQIGICTLLFFMSAFFQGEILPNNNSTYLTLFLLGLLPTAIGHNLFLNSFKHFETTTASIITSLQPIIAIVYAYFFVAETPSINTLIGGGIILCAVILENSKGLLLPKDVEAHNE